MMDRIDLTQSHDVIGAYKSQDYSYIRMKYQDEATQYCFDVLNEKQIAGYWMQLACFRHLQDLKRSELKTADFPYHYDLTKVDGILKFAKMCKDVNTQEPIELMAWQKMIVCQLIGWRDENGNKRFAEGNVSVARDQGKTYFAGIISCYSYLIETLGKSNQDLMAASNVTSQSKKLFGYIGFMLSRLIEDYEMFELIAHEQDINIQHDQVIAKQVNNRLVRLSNESGKFDSYHFLTAVYDEVGDPNAGKNLSKITSGQIKTPNKQFIKISTAYPEPNVQFHQDIKKLIIAMEKDYSRELDHQLCLVWCQDNLEETFQPETWEKSNPLLGLKSMHGILLKGLLDERENQMSKGKLNEFQNKNLNMWLEEHTNSFLKYQDIISSITQESIDIKNRQVYIGWDTSMSSDDCSLAFVFPVDNRKFYMKQFSFIPWQQAGSIEAKEKADNMRYRDLANKGFCAITEHEQGLISEDQVYQWLVNFVIENNLEVLGLFYDAFHADKVIKALELNTSWPLMPVRQRTSELNDPTKFLQRLFVEGNILRDDDEIMEKSLQNAVTKSDSIGIQVDKNKATLKIDVVDAIIDGLYQAMYHFEDYANVNDPGKQFERMSEEEALKWLLSEDGGY